MNVVKGKDRLPQVTASKHIYNGKCELISAARLIVFLITVKLICTFMANCYVLDDVLI